MKEDWTNYFSVINLPEKAQEIVLKKCSEIECLCGVEIADLFISETKKETGAEYKSLWFFSTDEKVFECKNFIIEDDYDILCLHKNVAYYNMIKKNLDNFDEPAETSTITVNSYIRGISMTCDFTSTGLNCKQLIDISRKYFFPNLVSEPSA